MSAVASLLAGMIVLRLWKPKHQWRFPSERDPDARAGTDAGTAIDLTPARVARAWMPFGLLTLTVLFSNT